MLNSARERSVINTVLLLLVVHLTLVRCMEDSGNDNPHADSGHKDPTSHRKLTNKQYGEEERASNNVTVASLTLYLWEYLATFPREIMMYRRHMLSRPQVILFLLIRYGTLPAIIVTTYSFYGHFYHGCIEHQAITIAIVQIILSCIFAWRTAAIWRHSRIISIFLACLVASVTATSIALMYFFDFVLFADKDGMCRPGLDFKEGTTNTSPWFYLTAMVFDTTTMVLSSYKLITYARLGRDLEEPSRGTPSAKSSSVSIHEEPKPGGMFRRYSTHAVNLRNTLTAFVKFHHELNAWTMAFTPLIARLFYNGLVYFAVATAFNLVNFVLELTKSLHSKTLLPLYAPLMCVLCQRMLLVEFDFVWASNFPHLELPGLRLVDHVTGSNKNSSQQLQTDRLTELINTLEERRNSTARRPRSGVDMEEGNVDPDVETPETKLSTHGDCGTASVHAPQMHPVSPESSSASDQQRRPSAISFDMPSPRCRTASINDNNSQSPTEVPTLSPWQRHLALRMAGL